MSGFWYTAAIATTVSTLLTLGISLGVSGDTPARRTAFEQLSAKLVTSRQPGSDQTQAARGKAARRKVAKEEAAKEEAANKDANQANFGQATALAHQAVNAYQAAQKAETPVTSIAFTRREKRLWRSSIQKLSAIPKDAPLYPQANDKKAHYTTLLTTAERKLLAADSAFITDVISDAQLSPDDIHITLCQIDVPPGTIGISGLEARGGFNPDHCRHHQGELLLASPASLIKLPIAIALLDKINTENLDLNGQLYIDPDNFTENAIGATIEVDQEYPLVQVMGRMIDESNNIATNQLIDYVGREDIAKTLAKQGYQDTFVDHKLAGDRILPPNPGTQSNRITTDDVTTMMVNTYRLSHPGDEALLEALLDQKDQELGYQALKELSEELNSQSSDDSGSDYQVEWMGEKTGQNERMLGTTLAMKIAGKRYALTVAINYSGEAIAIRNLIKGIALYLIENGPIASEANPPTAESASKPDPKSFPESHSEARPESRLEPSS